MPALIAAILLLCGSTAPSVAQSPPAKPAQAPAAKPMPSVDELVRYFDTIVFGSELDPKYASKVVAKWPQHLITISLEQLKTKEYLGFIQNHLTTLTKLTNRTFGGTPNHESADIRVFFVHKADMAKFEGPNVDPEAVKKGAAGGGCYFLSWKKPESQIVKALIVVNVDRDPAYTNSCLLEELTQSMGLPNDSDSLRPSIFSDKDHLFQLQLPDAILVRTLYDPRLELGMPRAQALKVARTIITELTKTITSRKQGG